MIIKSGVGLAAAGFAFLLFCVGAGWVARWLIRSNRAAVISTLPVVAEQTVAVDAPGELVVSVEVPRLSTGYSQLELEIVEQGNRQVHLMKYRGMSTTGTVKGFSSLKIPFGRLTLAQPDKLTIRIKGLAPDANYTPFHLLLMRPYLARIALQVVGLVVCGVGALASVIWACWLLGLMKTSS